MDKIKNIVISGLEELNEMLEKKIEFSDSMILIGQGAVLDSFDFVNLTVILEEKISDELNKDVTLVNEKAFSRKNSPFKNIDSLVEYIKELVGE